MDDDELLTRERLRDVVSRLQPPEDAHEFWKHGFLMACQSMVALFDADLAAEVAGCPLHNDHAHPTWAEYVAKNLKDALAQVPDTGDWHGALRAWCDRTIAKAGER